MPPAWLPVRKDLANRFVYRYEARRGTGVQLRFRVATAHVISRLCGSVIRQNSTTATVPLFLIVLHPDQTVCRATEKVARMPRAYSQYTIHACECMSTVARATAQL